MSRFSKVAITGGLLIILGGIGLSGYTLWAKEEIFEPKKKIVEKYIKMAKESKNIKEAKKFLIKALMVDPSNKQILKEYEALLLKGCENSQNNLSKDNKNLNDKNTTSTKPATPKEAESDDEMGCI
ncbi:MAG: hypothetical protein GXO02_04230 [Epsilonproteobacteria bacterium]|jgi:hypothetical protein|nr:hypothetical protein [Campylobacterota bacterium]